MGRKKLWEHDRDRQRAYRERKKVAQEEAFQKKLRLGEQRAKKDGDAVAKTKLPWTEGKPIETESDLMDYLDQFKHDDILWCCEECQTWTYYLYPRCRHCGAQMTIKQDQERELFFELHVEAQPFREDIERRYEQARIRQEALKDAKE